jgi:hypothetical protein
MGSDSKYLAISYCTIPTNSVGGAVDDKKIRVNPSGGGQNDDDNTVPDGGPNNDDGHPRRGTPPVQVPKPVQIQCVTWNHSIYDLPPLGCSKTLD